MVWAINGLVKLFDLVPRHKEIVSSILSAKWGPLLTRTIGVLELMMVVWILAGIKRRWCVYTQVVAVGLMNMLECLLVPKLLLFGRINGLIAALFITVILVNEFNLRYRNRLPSSHT